MIKINCKICGKEYLTYPSKGNKKITCSKECCKELRRIMMIGDTRGFRKGCISLMKGKHHTKKIKEKLSKMFHQNYKKENHYNYGKKLSKETCKKKSLSIKKAYKECKMNHMKDIWKENSKRWQGKNNPRWTGGWYIDKHNYKYIHDDKNRWRKEHRVVVEKIIGRDLERYETIHHINENKLDNRLCNLYYFSNDSLHKRHHGLNNKPKLKSNINKIRF